MSDEECQHTQIEENHGEHGHACYACDEELPNPDECWECTADNAIAALAELRAQLAAVEKERDAVITASIAAMMAMRVNLDAVAAERDALAARLAAAEKERDEAADSYEITLARMAENCAERQGERDALAARVARLEGALEPTVATHAVIAGFLGGAHQMWLATQILTALRARAGLTGKEGNRG